MLRRRRVVMVPFTTKYVDALETLSNVRRGSRHARRSRIIFQRILDLLVVIVFVIQRGRGGKQTTSKGAYTKPRRMGGRTKDIQKEQKKETEWRVNGPT